MWVVKLGGSLGRDDSLRHWLDLLCREYSTDTVVVPGGGRFAELVREAQARWRFDDLTAHHMALLAMHQSAWMWAGIQPAFSPVLGVSNVRRALAENKFPIWLPTLSELDKDGIPASWDVTSDSLAAWLAGKLQARHLVLVKSAFPSSQKPADLQNHGLIDGAFLEWLPEGIDFRCYHRNQLALFTQHRNQFQVSPLQS